MRRAKDRMSDVIVHLIIIVHLSIMFLSPLLTSSTCLFSNMFLLRHLPNQRTSLIHLPSPPTPPQRFDPGKGFYCRTDTGCLGPSKGRNYPPIDPESRHYLEKYFLEHNANLKLILRDIDEELPQWLKDTSVA